MTFHIGAKPGDIAPTVLLPGDPYRARWAAQKYLENPVLVNEVRGMLGYTGSWRGNRVTIHGSGMGMPSLSIYANELMKDYGAQTLIRIGSAGALQPHVKVRDVVLAQTASTCGSTPVMAAPWHCTQAGTWRPASPCITSCRPWASRAAGALPGSGAG